MNQHDDKKDGAEAWADQRGLTGEKREEAIMAWRAAERHSVDVWRNAFPSHVALPRIPTEEMLDDGAEAYFTTKDKHPPKGPDMATLLTASWTAMYDAAMKAAVPSVTLQGPSSFHTPGDPIGTAINEKQRQLNAASSAEREYPPITDSEMDALRKKFPQDHVASETVLDHIDAASSSSRATDEGDTPEEVARREAEWDALTAVIHANLRDYEFGEDGYQPTDEEKLIVEDFVQGLLADEKFMAAIAQVYPVRSQHAPRSSDTLHPVAYMGLRASPRGGVAFQTVAIDRMTLHNAGYEESEIKPLYYAPRSANGRPTE